MLGDVVMAEVPENADGLGGDECCHCKHHDHAGPISFGTPNHASSLALCGSSDRSQRIPYHEVGGIRTQ